MDGWKGSGLMKCCVLHAPGDLRCEYRNIPEVEPGELLVRVHNCGICGSDIPRILINGTYHYPTIPGHEFSGEVIGDTDEDFPEGTKVVIAPLIPCFRCEACENGHFGQCDHYGFLGSRRDGGFAEYVSVPKVCLLRCPDSVSYEEAAMIEPAAVALHGLYSGNLIAGESVTVFGCGTLGLLCIELAKCMGAFPIIALDIIDDKLKLASELGADICLNSGKSGWLDQLLKKTNGGTDVACETAGTALTQTKILQTVRKNGKVVYLGTAHDDVILKPREFEHIVRDEIHIVGSWNSYSAPYPGKEWRTCIQWLTEGKLYFRPLITRRIYLEDVFSSIKETAKNPGKNIKIMIDCTK